MPKGSWGIEVSYSSLKAVRLQFVQGRVELTDFEVIPYTPAPSRDEANLEQEIRQALTTFVSRHKIKRDTVVVSLLTHSTFNRTIKLVATTPERMREIIRYEAQNHIPFPLNEVVWTYQIINRVYQPGEEIEVVLFAIKKEIVDWFLALMTLGGIQVDILQFAPVALYNYVRLVTDLGESFVILDMGANNTDLILVDRDSFWIRNLPVTGNDLTKAIQEKFDLPFLEAENMKVNIAQSQQSGKVFAAIQPVLKDLVSEIHRSIGYYKSLATKPKAPNFTKIVLMGNATKTIYFDEFLGQRLQLEPVHITQLNKIEVHPKVDLARLNSQLVSLGVTLGLALQGLNLTTNRINLLPEEVIKAKIAARRKPFIAASLACLALILVILYFSAQHTYHRLTQALEPPKKFLKDWKDKNKTQAELMSQIEQIETRLKALRQITPEHNVYYKIFSALNEIPALQKNLPEPNFYIEKGNRKDLTKLAEFEKEKIWILEIRAKELPNPAKTATLIKLTLICGVVCRQASDGTPDLKGSQEFIKNNLVIPLADKFKIVTYDDPLPMFKGAAVSQLRTEEERIGFSEEKPKYHIFKVSLEIPL